MTSTAYLEAVGTAVPSQDIHRRFIEWATPRIAEPRARALFSRMAARSGIDHRWSVLPETPDGGSPVDPGGFYAGTTLPPTSRRMAFYAEAAPPLALAAITALSTKTSIDGITHLVVASCTGFVAPGIDQIIARRLGLDPGIERTLVGFMGCSAAVAALRVARHITRSDRAARVLVVTVELSTLHLSAANEIEPLLAMLQFADGAAATIVSAEPSRLALDRFFTTTLADSDSLIRWKIGDTGFKMHLSGEVPARIAALLHQPDARAMILQGRAPEELVWAVHAGGRSILDAVEAGLQLPQGTLAASRSVLSRFGNMSSATLMFVLADILEQPGREDGVAIAFGPGLAAEGFSFRRLK